jgi:hypothetical protein
MNSDDPQLTAYAINETSDSDSDQIEAALFHDPALLSEMRRLHHFTERLTLALKAEEAPPLHPHQRQSVLAACGCLPHIAAGPDRWWQRGAVLAAAAACVALALGAAIFHQAQHVDSLRPIVHSVIPTASEVSVRIAETESGQPPEFDPASGIPHGTTVEKLQALRSPDAAPADVGRPIVNWSVAPSPGDRFTKLPETAAQGSPTPAASARSQSGAPLVLQGRMPENRNASRSADLRLGAPPIEQKKSAAPVQSESKSR